MIETGAINLKKERERWERKGIFFKVAPDLFFGENETRRRKKGHYLIQRNLLSFV